MPKSYVVSGNRFILQILTPSIFQSSQEISQLPQTLLYKILENVYSGHITDSILFDILKSQQLPHFSYISSTTEKIATQLLHNQDNHDIAFIVEKDDRVVYAHKAILSTTTYFKTMFSKSFKEKDQDFITLKEVSYSTLVTLLHCLYLPDSAVDFTLETAFDLLFLADQ